MKSKVAIIGANESYKRAPFCHQEWEIWGCNSLWKQCTNADGVFCADRWFELHPMSVQTAEEMKAIADCPVPIYTLKDEAKWACRSIVYPLRDITARYHVKYFTCTFAYQIAMAIYEGFTDIGLFGIDLDVGTARERTVEKACVEFWLGVAYGKGINIHLPEESALCHQEYLYGYDYHEEVKEVNTFVDSVATVRLLEMQRVGHVYRIHDEEGNA